MGGKVFPDIEPWPNFNYWKQVRALKERFKDYPHTLIGSNQKDKPTYNDLDFAVELPRGVWDDFFVNEIVNTWQYKQLNPNLISVRVVMEERPHQIDFMLSRNMKYTKLAYHTPMNSRYKGVYRNLLLEAMIKVFTIHQENIGKDYVLRTRQHLDLTSGLTFLVQTKKTETQRFRTADRIVIETNFMKAIRRFLPNVLKADLNSYETVASAIYKEYGTGNYAVDYVRLIFDECDDIVKSMGLEVPVHYSTLLNLPGYAYA